ncbi:MAG: 3-hexulose-6-phosphate synthase [Methanonatronarchaeales archaeon]|nr:3-hexulose-6-phosphate synthase [Methanonatronarchaeales archaeon]
MILQVALDLTSLDRAMDIGEAARSGGADWLEAGTPLIKSEGMEAVRRLSERFSDAKIVADMKTLDTGSLEAEMATRAGADLVTVVGSSEDSTVEEAVESARRYGGEVVADLLGVDDPENRALELQGLGVSHLLVHTGIDAQMAGASPLDTLRRVASAVDIPVAVAGGIDASSAAGAVSAGADIVVVGGAITRTDDVKAAALRVREAVDSGGPAEQPEEAGRPSPSTANISDAAHRRGVVRGLGALLDTRAEGRALTVKTAPGDWGRVVRALEGAGEGDVVVVDAGGTEMAVWGELASLSALNRGVAAAVIDGGIRDVEEIMEAGFPVWYRHVTPEAGEPKGLGEVGGEVEVGGVRVSEGDYVVADPDGVVVIPSSRVEEVLRRGGMVEENEDRVRAEILEGSTLSEVLELERWERGD